MKIICVGRNYIDHAKELNNEVPTDPILFMKPDTAIMKSGEDLYIPEFTQDLHHEIEIILKISKVGKYIQPEFAGSYYSEIGLGIDFTARDIQDKLKGKGLPWECAKAFDKSAFISDFVSKEEFNLRDLNFSLHKNGKIQQEGNTIDMIFPFDILISKISRYFTLKTGDIIFTGTPAGVSQVIENDYLEGFLEDRKMFEVYIK